METLVHPFTVMIHRFALSCLAKQNKTKKKKSTKTEMSEKVANVHRKTLKDLQN